MKKQFKYYLIFWIALVSLFNVACFASPAEVDGYNKFAGAFWPGYIFIMAAFVIHLVFSYFTVSETNRKKKILNAPLITISFIELFIMVAAGTFCMVKPDLPAWVGIIVCYAVLVLSVLFLLSAKVVGENTMEANIALNEKTSRFRDFTDTASGLVSLAKDTEAKQILNKLYEAIRYSDPVSSEATAAEEDRIESLLSELKALLKNGEKEKLPGKAEELTELIELRNNKCKATKRQRI